MRAWLVKWLRAALALLAYEEGAASGRATRGAADKLIAYRKQMEIDHAVAKAESGAASDRAGAAQRLRDARF